MTSDQINKKIREIIQPQQKIIVAVSGGLDSMVLLYLLKENNFEIIAAHCNFMLRDQESDGDEQLVRQWCASRHIPVHVKSFDSKKILSEQGGNLQDVLRDLRYEWFEQLRKDNSFDLIAVAHHKQDVAETLLINFLKGTGVAGLHGIRSYSGNVVRPLLHCTKKDLLALAEHYKIPWREDSSNSKNNYTRNKIRNQLIPLAEEIFPNTINNLFLNAKRFAEVEQLYEESIERYRKKLLENRKGDFYIPLLKLRYCSPLDTILYELLKPFNFGAAQITEAVKLMHSESGKFISSSTHRLLKDRNFFIITPKNTECSNHILIDWKPQNKLAIKTAAFNLNISFEKMPVNISKDKNSAFIDIGLLEKPLILRKWKQGDYFYPFGMGRKKKKISRYLINEKIPLHEKENIWVMESNKKIVWVVGHRTDERFMLTKNTKEVMIATINN